MEKDFEFVFLDSYNNVISRTPPLASMQGASAGIPKGAITVAFKKAFWADIMYVGCLDQPGHYLFDVKHKKYNMDDHPLGTKLDGGFVPKLGRSGPEGVIRTSHHSAEKNDFTVLAFRDNSVDRRPGSHSTFVMPGTVEFPEAWVKANTAFPFVFERIIKRGIELVSE